MVWWTTFDTVLVVAALLVALIGVGALLRDHAKSGSRGWMTVVGTVFAILGFLAATLVTVNAMIPPIT